MLLLKKKKSQQYIKGKKNRATNLSFQICCYVILSFCVLLTFLLYLQEEEKTNEAETIVMSIFWPRICLLCILLVLTPRFAASD